MNRVDGFVLSVPIKNLPARTYAEVGLSNEFERPNDGRMITGDLSLEKTSPWSGSLRTGVQALVAPDVFIDTSLGYLSFGQNGLDVWEGRVLLSIAF
ncbi:hypothetical protein D3879_23370 [Pseudomonas cavernicola]|uniref:Autotransporter domain-containing protein n=1 Tax=Pseudomonas cavernicola TaxID=2320866 RepID=A0A418X8K1_9PSED|nr:hypothetical protein [Pseudomonas cavernicola]RJG08807.1 hypothetical protein D3879_23370 [Pseudomonas cavernicola]